jgi:hypothetical protein
LSFAQQAVGGATAPAEDELTRLQRRVDELEILLGRAVARLEKLSIELDATRAQNAWLHRQLFGQKSERIPAENLNSAWLAFCNEQQRDPSATPGCAL